jgi:hypothetical protein
MNGETMTALESRALVPLPPVPVTPKPHRHNLCGQCRTALRKPEPDDVARYVIGVLVDGDRYHLEVGSTGIKTACGIVLFPDDVA